MGSPSSVVGFVGLDDLRLTMASALVRSGYHVQGYEDSGTMMDGFLKLGGTKCANCKEAGRDASAVIVLASIEDQMDNLFFGEEGILKELHKDAVIIIQSPVSLARIQKLVKHLAGAGYTYIVDVHASRGVSKGLNGKVMATMSGKREAIEKAEAVVSAMDGKLYVFEGEVGVGSKIRMVNKLLEGIHLVVALEAMFLGARAGIHPSIIYDIISHAAGSSRVFVDIVPKLLSGDQAFGHSLRNAADNLGYIMDAAKSLTFPLPLSAVARQLLMHGFTSKSGEDADVAPFKVWENAFGINIQSAATADSYNPELLADQIKKSSHTVKKIGFIGLGAMGFGMATQLIKSKFHVTGFDVYKPTLSRFGSAGGMMAHTPAEASKDVDVLVVMVANEVQAENVLYGEAGSVSVLPDGASIILSSTISPGFMIRLEKRLHDENRNLKLVDAPVSGGVKRAGDGTLTIMASGTNEALECTGSVLSALSEKLYIIKGGCGAGSFVKMVNQMLAGVHIASAAEAMAFGARLDLNSRILFEVILQSGGASWMFENRVPHMLDNDYTPYSAIDIFVKDLGIVCHEGSNFKVPLHISAIAHQQFLSASAAGLGRQDDAAVVKMYEKLTGVKVEANPSVSKKDLLNSLPPEWSEDPLEIIQEMEHQNASKVLVVLDDDPTGTQTVHDIDVLTEWSIESLADQFSRKPVCFFILTNSRALSSEKAILLTKDICRNIDVAAKSTNVGYTVVLRGDSTLRGHFPEEADAAVSELGEMDAWVICPFFLQGGRYTIDDIHYVADSERLVPAGLTEFAKDAAFGYKSSNLREWVEEKTKGRIPASSVASISIQLLRSGGPDAVCEHLCSLHKGSTCIVNAASERDMAVFAAGMIKAEMKGRRFLCRTAASFVSARIGIKSKPPIRPNDLGINREYNGGLIVVGSYVPKTTKQVEELKSQYGHILKCIEISVDKLAMRSLEDREEEIGRAVDMADFFLKARKDTLLVTSRELIKGNSPTESLEINFKVSSALVDIVKRITTRPRYIVAKGGITSSDLATKALGARRAKVVGQALAGVPLWQLGPESRHPGVPYIVFPGNVGGNNALAEVYKNWAGPLRIPSTKELLLSAEEGGYAVGAFNVYNLEGAKAVIAAAEAEKSPAILQIHPGAFKHGGMPLVACCISAAEQASVPVTVHFDHGSSKQQLIEALEMGFNSLMVDGSHLPFEENISLTKYISSLAHSKKMLVEAELGRLSGTEDDLTVEDFEARLTDANQAERFIKETEIDALAVCIGNVHGTYPANGPNLRLNLLKELHELASKEGVILVLHGASGLPRDLVKECIKLGVRKFNVNTEVRKAYLESLSSPSKDLVHVMASATETMKAVVIEKMQLFGSSGKAI
ncbi:hypothetical protein QJS10_CPB12g01567 [Acorus calamus]|uniref:Ketose-bisphosphate aldolase class-II family protein n=1 Tax=Acorus calamus TaxID=4465 RepID=A0AAV9DM20_ACOCL|nr:hypothetical protein QJS10_CPB12g01567 [Acorus calamus]